MSESFPRNRRIRDGIAIAVAATALTSGLSGCSVFADKPKPALERCFDKPLPADRPPKQTGADISPVDYQRKVDEWYKKHNISTEQLAKDPIQLHYEKNGKHITGIPHIRKATGDTLKQGNVYIGNGNSHGSGFVAEASDIIITAAHVVDTENLNDLRVMNNKGQIRKVVDGCYIYEEDGHFADLLKERNKVTSRDTDLAVLRLESPLDSTPLAIANTFPERNTWTTFVNNQNVNDKLSYSPKWPAEYSGLVVSEAPDILGDIVMTGIDMSATPKPYKARPGASGGLVANTETGEIIGVSVAVSRNEGNAPFDAKQIESSYGLAIDAQFGPETGIDPTPAHIVGAEVIRWALSSPVPDPN